MEKREYRRLGMMVVALLLCAVLVLGALVMGPTRRKALSHEVRQWIPWSLFAPKVQTQAASVYVYDLTADHVVIKKNADEARYPASLTKLMTVYESLKHIDDLSAIAPVDKKSYQRLVSENASMAGFYGNERTTYRDLLYGAMLPSGGECADSLAINLAGSREDFAAWMNARAKALGLTKTHFQNPDGMDEEGQQMSARDVGELLRVALDDGNFRAILTKMHYTSTKTRNHPKGIAMTSTVLDHFEGHEISGWTLLGGETGTTMKAGLCLATLCEKKGHEYIVVVMGVPIEDFATRGEGHVEDTIAIMEAL